MLTVPESTAPFTGEVRLTADVGVGEGAGVGVGVIVGVGDVIGVGVGVGAGVGVGVDSELATVTLIDALPTTPEEFLPSARIVWAPLATVVESQVKVYGGDDLKYLPSM